ncbi:MAG: C-terminal target protein, partial [Bacteroidetes bacterium]|nr:C-terminal target protein [Bacteroidota bacterium]
IYNAVFAGWPIGLMVDGVQTQANATNGDLVLKNSVMSGMKTNFSVPSSQTWATSDEQSWYSTVAFANTLYTDNSSLDVADPFSLDAPDFTLTSASPLLAGSYWDASSGIISSSSGNNALTVYPNPAVSEVNVVLPTYDGVSTIQIQDLTGKTLLNKAAKNSELETVDVTSLNQGVYLISVRQGNTLYNQRLIVK